MLDCCSVCSTCSGWSHLLPLPSLDPSPSLSSAFFILPVYSIHSNSLSVYSIYQYLSIIPSITALSALSPSSPLFYSFCQLIQSTSFSDDWISPVIPHSLSLYALHLSNPSASFSLFPYSYSSSTIQAQSPPFSLISDPFPFASTRCFPSNSQSFSFLFLLLRFLHLGCHILPAFFTFSPTFSTLFFTYNFHVLPFCLFILIKKSRWQELHVCTIYCRLIIWKVSGLEQTSWLECHGAAACALFHPTSNHLPLSTSLSLSLVLACKKL